MKDDETQFLKQVEEEIKKLLIKQEFLDRKNGKPKMVEMKQTDYLKTGINLIKFIRKNFTM